MRRSRVVALASLLTSVAVVGLLGSTALADGPDAPPPATPAATEPVMPPPVAADAPTTNALVVKVQTFYDKTSSFHTPFTQEFWVKAYNQKKTSKGVVTFVKPGKMNWVYEEPAGNRIVSDGSNMRVYEAANHQMYEQTVDKSQYPAALSFLTGQGKLTDHFNFEMFPGESMRFPGGSVLVGSPKVASPAFQKVLFFVDNASSQVRRVLIIDGQGNRNRFDFLDPKVNEQVKPESFHFEPPQGTTVVRP